MADLEISVRYNSLPAKAVLMCIVMLLPAWGIIAPIAFMYFAYSIYSAITHATVMFNMGQVFSYMLGCLVLPIVGTLATLAFADNRIIANQSGLLLPLFELPFGRKIAWSHLKKIAVKKGTKPQSSQLILYTDDGRRIHLTVSCLKDTELEQLLLAADVWGGECEKAPELLELQESLHKPKNKSDLSYTAMWEEELGRRYASTAFMPLEPDATLKSGTVKVVRQLSFGGLSAIYLCLRDQKDLVVLKEAVIPTGNKEEVRSKALELFQREAELLTKLDHPAIVKVLDHFTENDRHYLLLEYINGQDLRQFVKQNGPQPERIVLRWALQAVKILEFLHAQEPKVLHRDLTPDNLVVKEDESITLIDFGAANEMLGQATGTLVGKQSYIAPEQFRGKASEQSDLYALGCTIFYLLTGEDPEPLSHSRPLDTLPLERRGSVSAELDQLVADLTEMELADRIQRATDARERLQELMAPSIARHIPPTDFDLQTAI